MKRISLFVVLSLFLTATVVNAQPVPEPKAKAPVAKKAPAKKAPAKKAAPAAKVPEPKAAETVVTPEVKVEGKVELVEPKVEEKKAEEPVVAPVVAESDGLGYGGVALNHAIKLGFLLVFLLLSGLIRVLMKKFGFQEHTAKVDDVLKRAKSHAEQWSLKKAGVDEAAKPGGPDKMDKAVTFALDLAKDYKLPEKGKEWWEDQLESWIGMEKNGG